MRAFNKLAKRFEWAILNKKPIYPNKDDVDAINELAQYFETQNHNTNLEDSLILFWIFRNWKIVLDEQHILFKEQKQGFIELPEIDLLLDKFLVMLNPKDAIIEETTLMLQLAQRMSGHDETITESEVKEMFEDFLTKIKHYGYPIKQLGKYKKLRTERNELSRGAKKLLGL